MTIVAATDPQLTHIIYHVKHNLDECKHKILNVAAVQRHNTAFLEHTYMYM